MLSFVHSEPLLLAGLNPLTLCNSHIYLNCFDFNTYFIYKASPLGSIFMGCCLSTFYLQFICVQTVELTSLL